MGAVQEGEQIQQWRKKPCVVLRAKQDTTDPDKDVAVWVTKGLEDILDGCADLFESKTDSGNKRRTYWLSPIVAGRLVG